jgi:hypothetical protein
MRACVWYLKVINGEAGVSVKKLAFDIYAEDELWSNSCLFKPAYLLLTRLSKLSGINLFGLSHKDRSEGIKDAMFLELTGSWRSSSLSRFTYSIHPQWKSIILSSHMISKFSTSLYHQYAVGRAPTKAMLCSWNKANSTKCRRGCGVIESVEHILFNCSHYSNFRNDLQIECLKLNLPYNLSTLLSNNHLKTLMEKLLAFVHR